MSSYSVIDLTPQCEIREKSQYEYQLLEKIPGALDLIVDFSTKIWSTPEEFEIVIRKENCELIWRWRACGKAAGIATLRNEFKTQSLSLVASGLDADSDRITLETFQRFAVQELHNTEFEPSFDLLGLTQRPVIATVGFQVPEERGARWLFALADRCFAAAYFRYLGIA
jgi:hypothetical protein